MKKLFTMLLTMFIYMVSVHAQNFTVDGISYNVISEPSGDTPGEVEVTGGEIKEVIEFPETVTYNEVTYMVTSIGRGAFSGRRDSENYTLKYDIPGTVKTIKDGAFYDNYYLEEVEFNEGLETIGRSAFGYAFQLKGIQIPSTVTSIAADAFITNQQNRATTISCLSTTPPSIQPSSFSGRTDATFIVPKGTRSDYKSAAGWDFAFMFEEGETIVVWEEIDGQGVCYTLRKADDSSFYCSVTGYSDELATEIVIPAEHCGIPVTNIGDRAFYNCSNLISVTIPSSVTSIGSNVLYNLYSDENRVVKIVVEDYSEFCNNRIVEAFNFGSNYGPVIQLIDKKGDEITDFIIPEGVTSIGNSTFFHCTDILTITFPSSMTGIGDYAFQGCNGLSSINIPNNVTTIGEGAFSDCIGLTSVKTGSGVRSIGNLAFASCENLTSVRMGKNVSSIGDYTFSDCSNLISITLPNRLESIGKCAFQRCGLTAIIIPNSVASIGKYAFSKCNSLTFAILGDQLTSIGEYAFSNCTTLSSIVIPNSVSSLGAFAFGNCI